MKRFMRMDYERTPTRGTVLVSARNLCSISLSLCSCWTFWKSSSSAFSANIFFLSDSHLRVEDEKPQYYQKIHSQVGAGVHDQEPRTLRYLASSTMSRN